VNVLQAYIFINTEPGKLWEVAENALKIEGVRMAHAVTGQYDVIIYAEFVNIDMLGKLIDAIHALKGVLRTQTAIAMVPRLKG